MTDRTRRFEAATVPHLNAAYNLARWLLRDDRHAEDVVQDACLRAFRHFDQLRGDSARPWLLGIVRNACHDWLRRQRHVDDELEFDELRDSQASLSAGGQGSHDPAALHEQREQGERVNQAIAALAPGFREVIVLRELEELSYEEIARVAGIPIGTVMSRLSRARAMLRAALITEACAAKPTRNDDGHA